MSFNDDLATMGAYNAASGRPSLAGIGIMKAFQKRDKDPNVNVDEDLKHCLSISRAIRFAKREKIPEKGKDRKYFYKDVLLYCGVKDAIDKELTSDFSSENVGELGKKVQEFWCKWEPRCDEIESLVEKIKSGEIKVEDCKENVLYGNVTNYFHEIESIVEKNLGEESRRARSYISGFPIIVSRSR